MLAISLVVALLMVSFNTFNYLNIRNQVDKRIDMLVEHKGSFPSDFEKNPLPFIQRDLSIETPFDTRYFTIIVGSDNQILKVDIEKIAAVDIDSALDYAQRVIDSNKNNGILDYFFYRYVFENEGGSLIIFVDCERELINFTNTLTSSLAISGIGLLLVFVLLVIFSKSAIKPIAESYQKQKQFITNASHDLKTPLTIIDANTEIMEMENGETEWSKSTHHQVSRLSDLTNKLVLLSKMDEEINSKTFELIDLSKLLNDTVNDFQPVFETKNIKFISNIKEDLKLKCQASSIIQMMELLLDNALKYCVDEINLEANEKNNNIIIKLSNNVEDIKPGNHNELFDRFYRRDNESRNSENGGHGIGLSIVLSIVNMNKGKITAKSNDNKSITFLITFPK